MNILKKISLDEWRFIASLLIIAIHIYPFTSINEEFDFLFTHVFCRIAVPLFLMITGYYLIPKALKDKNSLIVYTKKITKLYLISILIYLPINIYTGIFKDFNLIEFLKSIFINGTFYHLWYFPALIFGLWLTYFIIKNFQDKTVKIVVLLLFIIGTFGDSYFGISSKISILNSFYNYLFLLSSYTRNGLFYVPIFLCIGYSFNKQLVIDERKNFSLLVIYLVLMEIEGFILHNLKLQKHDSMYFFLIPVSFYLFSLIIQSKEKTSKKLRNISTTIYIIHPLFIIIIRLIAKIVHLENIMIDNNLIHYLCVLLSSVIFSIIFEKVKEVVKNEKNKRKIRLSSDRQGLG